MKSSLKNILFITLPTTIVLFFILEIAVRLILPKLDLDELTGRNQTINPMSEWAINDPYSAYSPIVGKYGENKTVNSAGFISTPEINLKKDSHALRILFLGESSTAGTGTNLADSVTWPWRTAELLKKMNKIEGRQIEFINGALGGYCSFESYGRLWSRLRFYNPDVIVVNHGWNDMYYFNSLDTIHTYKKGFSVTKLTTLPLIKPHWIDPFVSWSQILSRVRYKVVGGMDPTDGEINSSNDSEYATEFQAGSLQVYGDNLRLIQEFGKQRGIDVYFCKQATLIAPGIPQEDKDRCKYGYHKLTHDAHLVAYAGVYDVIDSLCKPNRVIDLTSLNGVSRYFHDHVHPTDEGAQVMAKIVADSLSKHWIK
jgi:lysophospholipase L1-like esterase